jgi:hypothetical protein
MNDSPELALLTMIERGHSCPTPETMVMLQKDPKAAGVQFTNRRKAKIALRCQSGANFRV